MNNFKDLNKLVKEFNNKVIKFKTTKHKPKLISRHKILEFPLVELLEYRACCYGWEKMNSNNSFNKYLLDYNLQVTEEMLEDAIEYLQSKGCLYD